MKRADESKIKTVTLNLTEEYMVILRALADQAGLSMADVVRRCIATELFVQAAIERGGKLIIEEADGTFKKVVFKR